MKRTAAALLLALAAACAAPADPATEPTPAPAPTSTTTAAPAPAATFNPVGRYEFNTIVNGQPMAGVIVLEGQAGAYTGRIESNLIPHASITSATVNGQQVVLVAAVPQGDVTITLNMNGSAFTGNWAIGGDTGEISGRKVS